MGLFSKKSDVPELPRAPALPRLPNAAPSSMNPHTLPSISNVKSDDVKNNMVKSAVTDTDSREEMSSPEQRLPVMSQMDEGSEHRKEVFVKLDKFKQAQKTFMQMKDKLADIDSLINKAKQLNEREKAELGEWGEEVNSIKSKLTEIDSGVFNQV